MDFNISDYLKKFENFLPTETRMRRAVATAILEGSGIEINPKQISVHGKAVSVNAPSIIKSEIAMKQCKIMEKIKENKHIQGIDKVQ